MERVILHVDGNNFFASCECLLRPELAGVPMAVAGDRESRHGIILAKNQLAKACLLYTSLFFLSVLAPIIISDGKAWQVRKRIALFPPVCYHEE